MGKHKILYTVYIAVLTFHIRESQSRSLNDNKLEHIMTKKSGSIEVGKPKCFCLPKTVNRTLDSKFVPISHGKERLVIYLLKDRDSDEIYTFIPSFKKQITFPYSRYETGDTIVEPNGTIILFDTTKVPQLEKQTTEANQKVTDEQFDVTTKPDVSNLEILNSPLTDHQHKPHSDDSLNDMNMEIPPEAESVVLPNTDNIILHGVNPNPNVNVSIGKKEQLVNGSFINYSEQPNEPENQNQQTLGILNGINTHILLGKPGQKGETISFGLPKFPSQSLSNHQNQKLHLPLRHQYQLIKGIPYVFNNLNMPMIGSHDSRKILKYILPQYGVLPPSKPHKIIMSPSGIDIESPNKQSDIVNFGYSPSKYEKPTFDNWYKEQMKSLRSKRPLTSNAIKLHSLKLLLMKALNENGIRLSKDGDLLDSNGNILKMSNLKLRPILLSDPMDYKRLIATKNCVIPYDLPYLEAILVTLIYPPRILAIIPLGLEKIFVPTSRGKIAPLRSQSNCNTHENFRSGLPEKEDIRSDVNDIEDKDNNKNEKKSAELIEEEKSNNNIESKSDYTHVPINNDLPAKLSIKPLQKSTDDQDKSDTAEDRSNQIVEVEPLFTANDLPLEVSLESKSDSRNLLLTPSYSNPEVSDGEIFKPWRLIPKDFNIKCVNGHCRTSYDIHNSDYDERTAEDTLQIIDKEPVYDSNDIVNNNDYQYVALNNDLLQNKEGDQSDSYMTATSRNDPGHWAEPKISENTVTDIYLDERAAIEEGKSLENVDFPQEIPKNLDEEDYEVLMIRIVGGNPATSSGSPVNNKGRSGSDF